MASSKYKKYINTIPVIVPDEGVDVPELFLPSLEILIDKDYANPKFTAGCHVITQAFEIAGGHKHDFDEIFYFTGTDCNNLQDLGGEVEVSFFENGKVVEAYSSTKAFWGYMPKGVYHSLNFKKVNDFSKPILFNHMFFTTQYTVDRMKGAKA